MWAATRPSPWMTTVSRTSVYHDWTNGDLKYANWTGTAWAIAWVDGSSGDVGSFSALALGPQGRASISYYDLTNNALKVATRADAAWVTEVVERAGNVGDESALALDAAGRPHISYHDVMGEALKYARWTGTQWISEAVDEGVGAGADSDLALDRVGDPHISYYDAANGYLKYARRTKTGWQVQVVDQAGNVGLSSALALDADDRPVIAYHDATAGVLKVAWWSGNGWWLQAVDQIGSRSPSYISLALAADGTPHVAYYDVDAGDLKYARSRYPMPAADWEITTVDSAGDVGGYNSLALNAVGMPFISYLDWTNSTLKVAELTSSGWISETVTEIGSTGHNSLAVDRRGDVRIAFYDDRQADLMLATRPASNLPGAPRWTIETVASRGEVGAYPSLALDAAGRPWISYYDATNGDLKCAEGMPAFKRVYLPVIVSGNAGSR